MTRSSVDLPQPLGPMRVTKRPRETLRSIGPRAGTGPSSVMYVFDTPETTSPGWSSTAGLKTWPGRAAPGREPKVGPLPARFGALVQRHREDVTAQARHLQTARR